MRKLKSLLPEIRILFDGEGGDAGAATGETAPAAGEQTGEMQSAAGSDKTPEITPEERANNFRSMIHGDYKDLYDAEVQKILKSRLKGVDGLRKQVTEQQDIIDRLSSRYGVTDLSEIAKAIDNDTAMWEEAADKAGMTVEQFMQFQGLERQNHQLLLAEQERYAQQQQQQQLNAWLKEAESMKEKYPDFDLDTELQNPDFVYLLAGRDRTYSMEHAYKMAHFDELINNATHNAAAQAEKNVAENIKAMGMRPSENGVQQNHGAFSTTRDYKNMSLNEMQLIAEQIKSGRISLSDI